MWYFLAVCYLALPVFISFMRVLLSYGEIKHVFLHIITLRMNYTAYPPQRLKIRKAFLLFSEF